MKVSIGLPAKSLSEAAKILNQLLADEHVLYIKTRNAHWNVTGPDFSSMHEFFESQYNQLEEMIDEIAERVRMVGGIAEGTMKGFLNLSNLKEYAEKKTDSLSFIRNLLADHESIIKTTRENIDKVGEELKDEGTADFLTEVLQDHEKMAWMLRAHLD
jgi:starvation-inducible DNA-binding protein